MAHTEFHGERDPFDDEGLRDYFIPRNVGLQKRKPAFKLTVPNGEGKVRLVSATPITEVDADDLQDLIDSLQEAKEYLDTH